MPEPLEVVSRPIPRLRVHAYQERRSLAHCLQERQLSAAKQLETVQNYEPGQTGAFHHRLGCIKRLSRRMNPTPDGSNSSP